MNCVSPKLKLYHGKWQSHMLTLNQGEEKQILAVKQVHSL